jgi:hypothetical protein
MAQIIAARLADDFNSSAEIIGSIHSKFRTVINVLFTMPLGSNRLVAIITPRINGIPDSITVQEEYFAKISMLPVGSKVSCKDLIVHFDGISEALEGDTRCHRHSKIIIENSIAETAGLPNFLRYPEELKDFCVRYSCTDGFSVLSTEKKNDIASDLQCFSKAWLEQDFIKMESILLKHAGRGIGLTPSCDDAFLGIIAVYSGARLYADTPAGRACNGLKAWRDLAHIGSITPFNRLLFNRTTDVSLKYLSCCQEGRFSDAMIDLIMVIFSGTEEDLEPYIKSVSLVGGSSGMDTLFGTEIACRELSKSKYVDKKINNLRSRRRLK